VTDSLSTSNIWVCIVNIVGKLIPEWSFSQSFLVDDWIFHKILATNEWKVKGVILYTAVADIYTEQ